MLDVNEFTPIFDISPSTGYECRLDEDVADGTLCATVISRDLDGTGATITFTLIGGGDGKFAIDESNGRVTTAEGLDRESKASYVLVVGATDSGVPPRSNTTTIKVGGG